MRKLVLLTSYFLLVPVILFTLILYSLFLVHTDNSGTSKTLDIFRINAQFQALPEDTHLMEIKITQEDGRIEALREFFNQYDSPLLPYADHIVHQADEHELDYRLIPAIAMQESNLCKKIPKNSYNCWGFGIYGSKVTRFDDYAQAITTVTKTLAREYIGKGLAEPHEIMTKYTPGSNGSWAESVNFFMGKIHSSL